MANDGFPPTGPNGTNHGQSKNTPTFPTNVKRDLEKMWPAAQLRAAGATFTEIGRALDIDPTWARTLVLKALDAVKHESADEMRRLEGARLDRMQRAVWEQALGDVNKGIMPDLRAMAAVVKIMERRARLFGLDAPVQVEVTTEIDRQLEALAAALPPLVVTGEVVADDGDAP